MSNPLTPFTPEQAAALREQLARFRDMFAQITELIRQQINRAAPAIRAMTAYAEALQNGRPAADPLGRAHQAAAAVRPRMTAQNRPAWVSPYGPAPRRH